MIYAKKISYALKNGLIDYGGVTPPNLIEEHYLAELFLNAFNEFDNFGRDWCEPKDI